MRSMLRSTLRSILCLAAGAATVLVTVLAGAAAPSAWGQEPAAAPSSAQTSASTPMAPPQDSLAEAARKARSRQKNDSNPPKVFTNDNIPTSGGISTVGAAGPATPDGASSAGAGAATPKGGGSSGEEKKWRDRFAQLNSTLDRDKAAVDVMQRELGVLDVQYYNDPVKAMQQGLTRDDINKKTADIDAKKLAVVADQQAISDAEDELRKAGGDPGWSR